VDHHIDTNAYDYQIEEKQIELIGSAATLVYERLLREYPGSVDRELAHFMKAPIMLDSYYFEPSLKESKWTDKDMAVF
jgi:inorganic pyrophosphatase/exopolyphosphatase